MSMPGWSVPQRMPNGLVIGPLTGQMKPPLGAVVGAGDVASVEPSPLEERLAAACAAWICAASCALASASAFDSPTSDEICAFVATSACDLLDRAPASLLWLASSSPRRIAACCTRALIARASFATPARTVFVFARATFTCCFAVATAAATCLSCFAIAPR